MNFAGTKHSLQSIRLSYFEDARVRRNCFLLLLPVLATLALYWPTSLSIAQLWADTTNHDYGHGWLIAIVCLWLLFRTAKDTPSVELAPSISGSLCLLILSMLWLLANQMSIQTIQQLLLPLLALAVFWAFFGMAVMRQCIVAITYFFFALPIWDALTSALQWAAVFAERFLLRLTGIPAYFEANTVHLPSGVIAIEGACSGLHFVIVGLALAVLYGYLNRIKNFVALLALAFALAVLSNWIRIYIIIVAGYATDMQHYLVRVEHIRFGWMVFAVMLWIFFAVAAKFPARPSEKPVPTPGVASKELSYRWLLTVALLGIFAIPIWRTAIAARPSVGLAPLAGPKLPRGWVAASLTDASWQPVFIGADSQSLLSLRTVDRDAQYFHAAFTEQRHGKKLAGYGNTVLGKSWSAIATVERGSMPNAAADAPVFIESEIIDQQGHHALIWQAYYVGDRWFTQPLRAQIWYGWKSLFTDYVSGVVAFRVHCDLTCEAARMTLREVTAYAAGN